MTNNSKSHEAFLIRMRALSGKHYDMLGCLATIKVNTAFGVPVVLCFSSKLAIWPKTIAGRHFSFKLASASIN